MTTFNQKENANTLLLAVDYSLSSSFLLNKISKNPTFISVLKPAIFLMRHALELFLKGMSEFTEETSNGHDLEKLKIIPLILFKKIIYPRTITFKKLAEDAIKKAKVNKIIDTEFVFKAVIEKIESETSILIERYNQHTYLENSRFEDPKNELLRYCDNENSEEFENKFDENKFKLENIKKDADRLYTIILTFIAIHMENYRVSINY